MPANKKKPVEKTPEQIMRANLAKTMTKLKREVVDAETLWLDLFTGILPCIISNYEGDKPDCWFLQKISLVSALTDEALSSYERRWGAISNL